MKRLIDAVRYQQLDEVKKLLNTRPIFGGYKGSNAINTEKDKKGVTALYAACEEGNAEIVELLINHGARSDIENIFFVAAINQHIPVMELLLKHGESVESPRKKDGASALYMCCFLEKEESVKFLIKNGANVNYQISHGEAPLHAAIKGLHPNICKILLENGADIHLPSEKEVTPYQAALRSENKKIIEVFDKYLKGLEEDIKRIQNSIDSLIKKKAGIEQSDYHSRILKQQKRIDWRKEVLDKAYKEQDKCRVFILNAYKAQKPCLDNKKVISNTQGQIISDLIKFN